MTHRPFQSYEIDLLVDDAWKFVGCSHHPETAKRAVYWTFTSVLGTTWTQPNDRHYFGMLRLKEEYGISLQVAGAAIAGEAQAQAAEAEGQPVGDGPGSEDDPLLRMLVERHAVKCVKEWLESQGWACEPIGKPFDLRCTKGAQELHAEVKGTRGKGKRVELTKNEVIHNQKPCVWDTGCNEQALFVVSEIMVTDHKPKGGQIGYAWPWKIISTVEHDDNLIPTTYDYLVPELTIVAS